MDLSPDTLPPLNGGCCDRNCGYSCSIDMAPWGSRTLINEELAAALITVVPQIALHFQQQHLAFSPDWVIVGVVSGSAPFPWLKIHDLNHQDASLVQVISAAGESAAVQQRCPQMIFLCSAYPLHWIGMAQMIMPLRSLALPQPSVPLSSIITTGISISGQLQTMAHPIEQHLIDHQPKIWLGTPYACPRVSPEKSTYWSRTVVHSFFAAYTKTYERLTAELSAIG